MAQGRTRCMHSAPEGYLEAFAFEKPARRTPALWRFERSSGQARIIAVRDAGVAKDIYTVGGRDRAPDTGIEEILCRIEGAFCAARQALLNGSDLTKDLWAALFRFVAAQLLRTPRAFQAMEALLNTRGDSYGLDDLRGVMLLLIERWIHRLARMPGGYAQGRAPSRTGSQPRHSCRARLS